MNDDDGSISRFNEMLMTTREVARAFNVDPTTVTQWAKMGKIAAIRTPGGHRRFKASTVITALTDGGLEVDNAHCVVKHALS